MIQKYSSNTSRAKSNTNRSTLNLLNKQKELPDSNLKPKLTSAVRIEERLLNQQIVYKRRLENLKKSLEEEQLKDVWDKPKISNKSRVLAQKVEKKLMQQINDPNRTTEDPPSPAIEKEPVQVQPENTSRSVSRVKNERTPSLGSQSHRTVTPRPSFAELVQQPAKTRHKSLLNLSVVQRNKIWLEMKQSKLTQRKREMEEKEVEGCTFAPVTQNKLNYSRSVRDPNSNTSYISSPFSLDLMLSEMPEQNLKIGTKMPLCRQIAPFQVKVSFKCGIDLNSFLKRAK